MAKKIIYSLMLISVFWMMSGLCLAADVLGTLGVETPNPTIDSGAETIVTDILATLQWAGFAIAVGIIVYIGIKYLMASADEKASLKSTVIKFLVGAFLIVNATTVLKLIYG